MSKPKAADKEKFSLMIEERALKTGSSHIDTIVAHCAEVGIDVESVKSLINKSLKDKIQAEAIELHYLKGKGSRLPV